MPKSREDTIIEKTAVAWASMDGKLDLFNKCKKDKAEEDKLGYYQGYLCDAQELIKRMRARGIKIG